MRLPVPGKQAIQLLMLDLIMNSSPMFSQRGKSRAPYGVTSLGGVVDVATRLGSVTGHVGKGSTALVLSTRTGFNAGKNRVK